MKKRRLSILTELVLISLTCLPSPTRGGTMLSNEYYTWGISGNDVNIPEGSIITEAVLTIENLAWDGNLHIHIVDNPPVGFITNEDRDSGDFFQNFGSLLSADSCRLVDGDSVFTFSRENDESSWVWDVFDYPFTVQLADSSVVSCSSSLLELIDYAGNSTPFGIGLDPEGSNYTFDGITLELTIESFEGDPRRTTQSFTVEVASSNHAPVITHIGIAGPNQVPANSTRQFVCTAYYDDGTGSPVSAVWSVEGDFAAIDNLGQLTTLDVHGIYIATVTAQYEQYQATYTVTVVCNYQAPVLSPIGDKTVTERKMLSFVVSAADPDSDLLSWQATNLPEGASFDNEALQFNWKPSFDQAGKYQVGFIVSNDCREASETITITVNQRQVRGGGKRRNKK